MQLGRSRRLDRGCNAKRTLTRRALLAMCTLFGLCCSQIIELFQGRFIKFSKDIIKIVFLLGQLKIRHLYRRSAAVSRCIEHVSSSIQVVSIVSDKSLCAKSQLGRSAINTVAAKDAFTVLVTIKQ